jgi:Tfp pilus assembly PilM family ATPase
MFRRSSDQERTILFVDLGVTSTQVVLSHGGSIVFARNLPIGGLQLDEAIAKGMGISVEYAHSLRVDAARTQGEEAVGELCEIIDGQINRITDEVLQCIRYYESVFHSQSIERIIFLGGQAHDKRLCQTIAQRMNLPAQIGDPLLRVVRVDGAGMSAGLTNRGPHPAWAVAVGLSLGGSEAA